MNKKHLAAAFAVFAVTTMSFSAFAASVDANARAYERAAAEQQRGVRARVPERAAEGVRDDAAREGEGRRGA